jgi:hypothetical protein
VRGEQIQDLHGAIGRRAAHGASVAWRVGFTKQPFVSDGKRRPELAGVFDKDDDENWGLIPRQDYSNIERQQRGLHSPSYERSRLSHRLEKSISNMHLELDRVIAAGR